MKNKLILSLFSFLVLLGMTKPASAEWSIRVDLTDAMHGGGNLFFEIETEVRRLRSSSPANPTAAQATALQQNVSSTIQRLTSDTTRYGPHFHVINGASITETAIKFSLFDGRALTAGASRFEITPAILKTALGNREL